MSGISENRTEIVQTEQEIWQEFTENNSPNDPDHILNCNGGKPYIHPPFRTGTPTVVDNVKVHSIYKLKENGNAYGGQIFHEKSDVRLYILPATIREQRRLKVLEDGVATSESRAIGGHTMKRYRKERKEFQEDNILPSFQGYKLKTNRPVLTYERAGKSEECFELTGKKGNTLREDIQFHTTHFINGFWTTDIQRYDMYVELASVKYDIDTEFITASGKASKQFWDGLRVLKKQNERDAEIENNALIEITIPSIVAEVETVDTDSMSEPETIVGTVSLIVNTSTGQSAEFDEKFSDDVHNYLPAVIQSTPECDLTPPMDEENTAVATTTDESLNVSNEIVTTSGDGETEVFSEFTLSSSVEPASNETDSVVEQLIVVKEDLQLEVDMKTEANKELQHENGVVRANRFVWKHRSFQMKKTARDMQRMNTAAVHVLQDALKRMNLDTLMIDFRVQDAPTSTKQNPKKIIQATKIRKSENSCNKTPPCDSTQLEVCDRCELQWVASVALNSLMFGLKEIHLSPIDFVEAGKVAGDIVLTEYAEVSTPKKFVPKLSSKRHLEETSRENYIRRRKIQSTSDEEFYSCDDEIPNQLTVEKRSNGKNRSGKLRSRHANMKRGSLQVTPTTTDSENEFELDLMLRKSLIQVRRVQQKSESEKAIPVIRFTDSDDSEV